VEDTANGFIEVAKSEKTIGEHINIATESEISMKELAQNLIDIINPKAQIITDEERLRPEKSEVFRLFGSATKIKELTNWKPQQDLNAGLTKTIEWFSKEENLRNYKADIYNI
jgi:nucleoside-diphosphate-sugar epimerase